MVKETANNSFTIQKTTTIIPFLQSRPGPTAALIMLPGNRLLLQAPYEGGAQKGRSSREKLYYMAPASLLHPPRDHCTTQPTAYSSWIFPSCSLYLARPYGPQHSLKTLILPLCEVYWAIPEVLVTTPLIDAQEAVPNPSHIPGYHKILYQGLRQGMVPSSPCCSFQLSTGNDFCRLAGS